MGTILSAKYVPAEWRNGFHCAAACKVTIEHADGWRVYGNLPTDLWNDAVTYGEATCNNGPCMDDGKSIDSGKLKGRKVQFDARIERSERDSKFGFFKRPTKAAILDATPVAA